MSGDTKAKTPSVLDRRALFGGVAVAVLALADTALAARNRRPAASKAKPKPVVRPIIPAKKPLPMLPVAKKTPITDTYFGETITDTYRWMENEKDPDWLPFLQGQSTYARAVLDTIPGRDTLEKRISALSGDTAAVSGVQQAGNYLFAQIRPVGADNFRLTVREGQNGIIRVLVDPASMLTGDGKHISLDWWSASPSGSHVVYGLSPSGSENSVVHIMDVATGRILPERMDRAQYASPSWMPDGSGFFFNRLAQGATLDTLDYYKNSQCWLHILGTDPKSDVLIMGAGKDATVSVDPIEFPNVFASAGSQWVIGILYGGVRRENPVYVASLSSAVMGKPAWAKVAEISDEVTSSALRGDDLYVLTTKGGDRGRVLKIRCTAPALSSAKVVVPLGDVVIDGIYPTSSGVFVQDLDGGYGQLRYLNDADELSTIKLPFEGSIGPISSSTDSPMAFVAMTGWINPNTIFAIDGAVGEMLNTGIAPQPNVDLSPYQAIRTFATSRDGIQIPLSIVCKKGLVRDGTNPTLVNAYGSYQITNGPAFAPRFLAFLEKGGVLATAGVRGGGEYGKEWWQDGKGANKPNTWRDLIACCKTLIGFGLTSPEKLAIQGGSAGGITVGRALTEAPELFAAVISNVGVNNTLRTELGQNGPPNVPEFGTVKDPVGYRALKAMDSVLAVQDGVKYPAVLLTTGATDPRVDPWQVAKMAARLQAASGSGKPVLLRVDFDAGHGLGSTRSQRDREVADTYAFLFWQLGLKGWAPA